jgi:hypothetical protein
MINSNFNFKIFLIIFVFIIFSKLSEAEYNDLNQNELNITDPSYQFNDIQSSDSVSIQEKPSYYVAPNFLNVRSKPSTNSRIVFKLYKGMEVIPSEEKDIHGVIWCKIIIGDKEYWICKQTSKNKYLVTPDDFDSYKVPVTPRGLKIFIDKSDRKLILFNGNGEIWDTTKVYSIGLCWSACDKGPKKKEGDGKTPEGFYYIASINPNSKFGKDPDNGCNLGSIHISYPNQFDAWQGFQNGTITLAEYKTISESANRKRATPQNTEHGSWIMIHGGGAYDWTDGCVALKDTNMKELLSFVVGEGAVPIEIQE